MASPRGSGPHLVDSTIRNPMTDASVLPTSLHPAFYRPPSKLLQLLELRAFSEFGAPWRCCPCCAPRRVATVTRCLCCRPYRERHLDQTVEGLSGRSRLRSARLGARPQPRSASWPRREDEGTPARNPSQLGAQGQRRRLEPRGSLRTRDRERRSRRGANRHHAGLAHPWRPALDQRLAGVRVGERPEHRRPATATSRAVPLRRCRLPRSTAAPTALSPGNAASNRRAPIPSASR
jgi:hypothetical protein